MEISLKDIELFTHKIKEYSDYDFSGYSKKSFSRRIEKILTDNGWELEQLVNRLDKHPEFIEELVKEITVNTTELFRDPELWITLKEDILPRYKYADNIKIWHVGMSSGQEVFSMIILLNELGLLDKTQIYGTDLNDDMIVEAQKGVYRYRVIADYLDNFNKVFDIHDKKKAKAQYDKYFSVDWIKAIIKFRKDILKKPIFEKHDIVKCINTFDTKFDIVVCRNLLIYFNQDLQNEIFYFFHTILSDNGLLILGTHESIMGNLITKFEKRNNFYYKRDVL